MTRCKFKVVKIERTEGQTVLMDADGNYVKNEKTGYNTYVPCEMWTVIMNPVSANNDPKHENSKFWASSPNGEFRITCVRKEVMAAYELGKEVYIDLTLAGGQ